jgi:hypothetical protein
MNARRRNNAGEPEQLVATAVVAERLGLKVETVSQWSAIRSSPRGG